MGAAVAFDVQFEQCTCSACGIVYFVPDHFRQSRRRDHQTFYCPNGHNQYFPQETEAERLKKELERERQRANMLAQTARTERLAHEATKRKIGRVEKGACPHCNRHFANVERHMRTKHKESTT